MNLFTGEQLLSIISQSKATPSDYLIKTYFKVFGIKNGELFEKFQRRFNNIQFNNFERISKELATTGFLTKAQEIVRDELRNVSYISCIYPYYVEKDPCPVIVQYFDPNRGIEHRILNYLSTFQGLSSLLSQAGILEKIVGYCGDFSYTDPATANRKSDHFSSLCILSNRRDDVKYLPYCDGFIDDLFEILVDYLPVNVLVCLDTLGKTFVKMKDKTQFVQGMVEKYNDWRNSERRGGILGSDFAKYVVDNFEATFNFFGPFQCLPRSIEALLCTVLKRYFLVLMLELYEKVKEIKLSDNCAVVYYFNLVQIQKLFNTYKEERFIPPKAYTFFNKEVARLVDNRVIDPKENKGDIDALYRDIFEMTDECYVRAIKYIDPLLQHFVNFDTFSWLLLKKSLDEHQVHQTYHLIIGNDCHNCDNLLIEIREINLLLIKTSLVEEETVVGKWITIIRNQGPFPVISKILEYLLALPASYNIIPSEIKEIKGGYYGNVKKMIRFNWRRIDVADDVEGFFGRLFETAVDLIKEHQMLPFVD